MKRNIGIFFGIVAAMVLVAMTIGGHSSRANMPGTVTVQISAP